MMTVSTSKRKNPTNNNARTTSTSSNNKMSKQIMHRRHHHRPLLRDLFLTTNNVQSTFLFLVISLLLSTPSTTEALTMGGEKAYFQTLQMTPNISHRQSVCERYDTFRNGTVDLKDALTGLQLHVGIASYAGAYFHYDPETGIDREYPGLTAVILDELGRRAKFTWRQSFGLTGDPADTNHTWKELLIWSTEAYDLQIDWWAQNLDRMNLGIGFLREWYDSSIILIAKELPEEISNEIALDNWLRPYDHRVWLMTIFTIFISGVVYQILEWYADDRQERSMWEWWLENFYLSSINFTQAYEYQPKTFASRLFGISMAIWALVMTATYTANLASLLVDRKPPPVIAETIDEVAVFGNKICTWDGTWSDDYVRLNHPGAVRIPKQTVIEMYKGLHTGECEYVADAVTSWKKLKSLKEYNPYCDLYWVGTDRKAFEVAAGFVHKVDAGDKCTGLIRDVLDVHMQDMIEDGFLSNAWDREFKRTADINCNTYRPELAAVIEEQLNGNTTTENDNDMDDGSGSRRGRNLLRSTPQHENTNVAAATRRRNNAVNDHRRRLKGATKGAAAGAVASYGDGEGGDAQKLTLEQMIGTFAFHWVIMLVALVCANINALYVRHAEKHAKKAAKDVSQKFRNSIRNVNEHLKLDAGAGGKRMGSSTKQEHDDEDLSFSEGEPPHQPPPFSSSDNNSNGAAGGAAPVAPKGDSIIQQQLDSMRQSQRNMQQSQSIMEQYQIQMQQAQLEMLQEQRRLQSQIQALLMAAQSSGANSNSVDDDDVFRNKNNNHSSCNKSNGNATMLLANGSGGSSWPGTNVLKRATSASTITASFDL